MNRYRVKTYAELTPEEFNDLQYERTERWQKVIRENNGTLVGVRFERDMVKVWLERESDPWHIPKNTFDIFFKNVTVNSHFNEDMFKL